MKRFSMVLLSIFFFFPYFSGCATISEAHSRQIHESLSFAPGADLSDYDRVAVLPFDCASPSCEKQHIVSLNDGASMSLSRVGYDVFEYDSLQHVMAASYQAVLVEESTLHTTTSTTTTTSAEGSRTETMPGFSMSIYGDESGGEIGISITDPETGEHVSVSAGAGMSGVHASVSAEEIEDIADTTSTTSTTVTTVTSTIPSVIVYEELPPAARYRVIEESGIKGVVTGRVHVSEPDSITGFVNVRTFIRLGDADTGRMIWQFEWEDIAHEGKKDIPEALNRTIRALEEALRTGLSSRSI